MANGLAISFTARDPVQNQMALVTRVIGLNTLNMAKVLRNGQISPNTAGISLKDLKKVMVS